MSFYLLSTVKKNSAGVSEISQLGLWGNYSIPKSNPFQGNADEQGEIYALGLRNPWRCSFDSERPEYFLCADVGKVCFLLNF